jgi:hypothetical protein
LVAGGQDIVLDILSRALDGDQDQSTQFEAASVVVGSALKDDDRTFIERCCLEVGARARPGCHLLGLAGLCLGNTARRFRTLSGEPVALADSLAARAERNAADVDGRALDGLEDIKQFLHRENLG